jgi:hypothetical protein
MGEMRNAYKALVGNMKGRELGRPRRIWDDNIRMDLKEIRVARCGMNASGSRWGSVAALMNTVINLLAP